MQYVKIKDALTEQIDAGALIPRQKLPSERQLAEFFNTTRITLRAALSLLESEGRIYREDRRGWFISPPPIIYDPSKTKNFMNLALEQEREAMTELMLSKASLANKYATQLLKLQPFANVYHVERLRMLEKRPVLFVINYIKAESFPGLLDKEFAQSLTNIYQADYQQEIKRAKYRIGTTSLFGHIAQALRATEGSPATLVEKVNYNEKGEMIDCSLEYWRHDAMRIEFIADLSLS